MHWPFFGLIAPPVDPAAAPSRVATARRGVRRPRWDDETFVERDLEEFPRRGAGVTNEET